MPPAGVPGASGDTPTRAGRHAAQQKFCSRACRIKHNNLKYKAKGNGARVAGAGETVIKLGPDPLPDRIERPLYVPAEREDDWLKGQLAVPKMPWERETAPG